MICPTPVNVLLDSYEAADHPERSWRRYCLLKAAELDADARSKELHALAIIAEPTALSSVPRPKSREERAEDFREMARQTRESATGYRRMANEDLDS